MEHECQKELCKQLATACAVLTDSTNEVRAHMFVCDEHAREMFAVNMDRERKLDLSVERIRLSQRLDDAGIHNETERESILKALKS